MSKPCRLLLIDSTSSLLPRSDILLMLAAPHADALKLDDPAFYLAYWPYLVHETLYALLAIALGVMLQLGEPGVTSSRSSSC